MAGRERLAHKEEGKHMATSYSSHILATSARPKIQRSTRHERKSLLVLSFLIISSPVDKIPYHHIQLWIKLLTTKRSSKPHNLPTNGRQVFFAALLGLLWVL
jgi:hypothetical protein